MNADRNIASGVLGVVVVTFNSSDVIIDCLESLVNVSCHPLHIVVCDNASADGTVDTIRQWIDAKNAELDSKQIAFAMRNSDDTEAIDLVAPSLTLAESAKNTGFAAAVNAGLRLLHATGGIEFFWVLNPDCVVSNETVDTFLQAASTGPFSLLGGRIRYIDGPQVIQSDGGLVSRWTGQCRSINQGFAPDQVEPPTVPELNFISGASMIASRPFYEQAGPMNEDYFLYYEEVDWASKRDSLPLAYCPDAIVFHHGGSSIGSGAYNRRPSAFANYFNFRNRLRYTWRHNRWAIPTAYAFSMLQILRLILQGGWTESVAALRGLNQMSPSAAIARRLAESSATFRSNRNGKPSA